MQQQGVAYTTGHMQSRTVCATDPRVMWP